MKIPYAFKTPFKGPVMVGVLYLILFMGVYGLYVYMPEVFRSQKVRACVDTDNLLQTAYQKDSISRLNVKVPIIMYHYVEYVADKRDIKRQIMNVSPEQLEGHIKDLIAHGYEMIFMKDVPEHLERKLFCGRYVVLTFDDGYADFYQYVYPLLQKYNIKATVYVIVNYIDRPDFLTKAQIEEMIESGLVEVGSHTLNHAYLKGTSYNVAREEIILSKHRLQEIFHIPIETFAYPYGALDNQAVRLVREASYSAAVSVEPGAHVSLNSKYIIPRVRPEQFGHDPVSVALPFIH